MQFVLSRGVDCRWGGLSGGCTAHAQSMLAGPHGGRIGRFGETAMMRRTTSGGTFRRGSTSREDHVDLIALLIISHCTRQATGQPGHAEIDSDLAACSRPSDTGPATLFRTEVDHCHAPASWRLLCHICRVARPAAAHYRLPSALSGCVERGACGDFPLCKWKGRTWAAVEQNWRR